MGRLDPYVITGKRWCVSTQSTLEKYFHYHYDGQE
jgi:hypothetical protein